MVSGTVVPTRHDQFVSRSLPPLKVRESNAAYLWVLLFTGVGGNAASVTDALPEKRREEC